MTKAEIRAAAIVFVKNLLADGVEYLTIAENVDDEQLTYVDAIYNETADICDTLRNVVEGW